MTIAPASPIRLSARREINARDESPITLSTHQLDLELHHVEKIGHWVHQEAPDVVNEHLLVWLRRFAR